MESGELQVISLSSSQPATSLWLNRAMLRDITLLNSIPKTRKTFGKWSKTKKIQLLCTHSTPWRCYRKHWQRQGQLTKFFFLHLLQHQPPTTLCTGSKFQSLYWVSRRAFMHCWRGGTSLQFGQRQSNWTGSSVSDNAKTYYNLLSSISGQAL